MNLTHNNFYSNTNYGLLNEDSAVTVDANDNWWGDASGPYDEETNPDDPDGQGTAISGNVMWYDWLSDFLILSISSVTDGWGIPGNHVCVDFQIYNSDSLSHSFDMTVIDSLDWYLTPYEFSFTLEGMADTIVSIMVTIPQEAELETENTIILSGTSTHDPAIIGSGDTKVIVMVGDRADLNTDGLINVLDAIRVVNIIIGIGDLPNAYENWAADCIGDGTVNVLDLLGIVNVILGIGECMP